MTASPHFSRSKMARMISFFRAHKRVITFSLVAFGAFWLTPSWSEVGPFDFLCFFALFVMPNMVNILLSHNPNGFDRAAELGIDLTLSGHSHGGGSCAGGPARTPRR